MSNYSPNRYAGNCLAPPLPAPQTTSSQCYTEIPGKCVDLEVEQGASFTHTILLPNTAKGVAYASSYTPGLAGEALITLSAADHAFEIGDCLYTYGICEGSAGYGVFQGNYTVIGVAGAVVSVAEEILGTSGVEVVLTNNASLCSANSGSLPIVYAMADLSNATLEMAAYNRGGTSYKYQQLRAVTVAGSNQVRVCPKGKVCLYDCVSIPSVGIVDAQVSDVFPSNGYDVVHLRSQTANQSNDCAELIGGSGKVTDFAVDMSKAACGQISFYLNPETTDIDGVSYLGTSELQESACYKPMKDDECGHRFEVGHFSIKLSSVDAATRRVASCYLQHGKLIGRGYAPSCASF